MTPPVPEQQIRAHLAALEAAPADEQAFRALEGIYERESRWEDLVALYELRARRDAGDGAGRLLAKAADLAHHRMRNAARAEELYRQVLHAEPHHAAALQAMVELHEERQDYPAVAEALEQLAGSTRDPAAAAELYLRLGRVHEERLLHRDRAALYYQRALRLAPGLEAARQAALRAQVALRRFAQAKRTLDEARERGLPLPALAAEYARLGALLVEEPLDHGLAMEALFEALALDRAAPGAAAAMERLKTAPRAWRGEAQALLDEAGRAKERRAAAQLTLKAAALHGAYDPDAPRRVVELVERALLLAPSLRHGLDLLERVFGERQDWRGLAAGLARLAAEVRDRAVVSELHLRLGQVDLVRFGDAVEAAAALERALALDPASEPAAQQLFELHLEAGRRAEALAALERHLAAAPERLHHVPWRLRAAEIAQALGDARRARAHLEAARRVDPRSPAVAAALAPLLERAGEWRALADALEAQVQAEREPLARARLLEALAQVELERLGAPREALRRLAEALRLDPGRAALRKAIDAAAARADLFPELARAYRAAAEAPGAAPAARKVLLRRAAEVWDRDLGLPEQAVEAWRALAAADPQDAGARAALDGCLVRAGHLSEVADDLRRRIAAAADPAARRELCAKLARSHEQAGDAAGAAGAWREVLAAGESAPALRGLADALAALGPAHAAEQAEVLGRLAGHLAGAERSEAELARALLLAGPAARGAEAAPLLVALVQGGALPAERRTEAVAALEALLAAGVEPVAVAEALLAVHRAGGDRARQVALLEHLAARRPDLSGEERARRFLEAAQLREAQGDARGALTAAAAALRAAPGPGEALDACERLARGAGAVGELYALLDEAAARLEGRPDEERALRRRAAEIAEDELGNLEEASGQLKRVLALSPGDAAARAALGRLAASEAGAEASPEPPPAPAPAGGEPEPRRRLAELEGQAARAATPGDRAAAEREASQVWGERLGQWSLAFAALARAARATPADVAVRAELRQAAARAGADADAARAYHAFLPTLAGAEAALAWRELAALYEERLSDAARAARALGEALRHAPGDPAALASLARLHGAAGRERERAEASLLLAERARTDAERLGALRDAAEALERLGDAPRAAEAWARAAALAPDDEGSRAALERLYERLDRPAELCALLERRAGPGSPRDLPLAFRLAGLKLRLGAPAEALALLRAVLAADPAHEGARAALVELSAAPGGPGAEALALADRALAARGEHAGRVLLREKRLARATEPAERARLHAELRALHERELGRPELALGAAARALAEGGPVAAEAEPEVERLAALTGHPERLAEAYEAAAAAAAGGVALELRRRAARVRAERLADVAAAAAAWSQVREAAPDDREALEALARLFARAGDTARLDEVARRRAEQEQGAERAARLAALAAQEEGLGDAARALAAAEAALAADPRSAAALEVEARLHRAGGRAGALSEVLARQAELARDDGARRQDLLCERAALLEGEGDGRAALEAWAEVLAESRQEPRALAGLDRLLAREATRDAAARILEDVYRVRGDARRLAALLEARLDGADRSERAPLLAELAALHDRLGDRAAAFRAHTRALGELTAPGQDDPALRGELERLASAGGLFAELAEVYEGLLARGLPAAARPEVRRRLASLYADRLQRPDLAARALEALASETGDAEALAGLVRLYRAQGAWRELAATLARQAERAPSPEAKKEFLLEMATVLDERLSDREGAMDAYRQILAVDPEDPNALRVLGRLLGSAERWDELVEVLGREVALAEKKVNLVAEAAELRFRLGRIRQQRLADVAGALQCYRGVLDKVPRHPAALAALEELARAGGAGAPEASALLEPIYAQEGEHQKLAQTLEARAAAATDASSRAALLRRVAEVQAGPLRNPELGFLTAARAAREDPEAPESLQLAGRIGEANGLTDELASLIAELAERAHGARARAELRRRAAHLTERGGDPARAGEAWQRVLELAPDDAEALAGVARAHRATGAAEPLAATLRRLLAVTEDAAARPALLAELAALQEERLSDPAGAIATLRRLLEAEPDRRDALVRLDRLCVAAEKWVELADVLAREVALADASGDAAAARGFRQRLGELKETRLLDREGALALYEQILAGHPDDPAALARLEAILQKDPAQARAAAALERAYAASGAWARYAAVLEVRAGERPDPVERKALFLELAEVQEKRLGNGELAFLALCRAFRDDPADPALRAELTRLAQQGDHAEELAGLYEDEFGKLPQAAAAEVALALGGLYEGKLQAPDAAVRWFEEARRQDPAGAPKALAALDRLYRARNQPEPLAGVLEAEAALAGADERAAFLFRLGQLAEEELRDPARAARAYEALLAAEPRQPAALRALERLYEAAGQTEALAENLAAQRELGADGAVRLTLTARLAALRQQLGRDEEALALWREALGQDPRHEPALAALEGLYEKLERWPELAELLRARLAVTADRREAARMQEKLGALSAGRLGDGAGAVRAYLAVLDADPRHRRALEALRDLYAAQDDLEGLASVYRRLVPLQEGAGGVKATRLALADVLLRAGKKGEAAEQGRRALELEPHGDEELSRLAAIFEAAGAPQDRVKAVEARAGLLAAAGRADEAVLAWQAAAEGWEKPLGRPEAAAAALEKVLELAPDRRDAWLKLKELYARAGNWRAYVRVSDLFTTHLADRAERRAVLKELGEIHEKRLGQKEMAFITWCRAFGDDPADADAVAAIQRLAAETGAFDELAAVYEQVADEAKGLARAKLLLQLGRVKDRRLDDADGAEAAFRRALEVDPASPEALDALTELFTRRGRVKDLVIALEQKLEAAAGLEEKKATLLEMARIYDGQLHDAGEAITALKRVLELDGADAAALEALATLYRREARWGDLAGILARARDLAPDEETRVAYQLQIAGLHENEIADDEAAVEAYRAVLGQDDRNRAALDGLERLYTKLDRYAELNRVYERQAALTGDAREKVRILAKSAAIWQEKLSDPRKAIEQNEAVLALDGQNLAAARNLETLYRAEGAWEKLIAVLQHHASLTQDRKELTGLLVQMGDAWSKELGRADRAEAMYASAVEGDPEAREAVSALARLYEQSGNWNLALDMLQREAKLAQGPDAVEIQARIGRIQEEMLQDRGSAKLAYARALDADPGHLASLRALRSIAEAERDRDAYLRYLLAEARYVDAPEEKARLLHEAGRIHQEERDDPDGAARLYEEALRKVPDFLPAARPLADLHVARADWPRAEAVLDVVVARLEKDGEAKELCRQAYRRGYVAEKLGKREKALASYRRAYELDATYLPALEGLGHLLVEDGAFEEALKIHQAILIHHRDGLTDLEVVETYFQVGHIQARLGQGERAQKSLEKALEIDAGHEPSRRAMVGLLEAAGDYERAVEHRLKLAGVLTGPARLEMLVAAGALCRDKLQDPYQAIDAFTSAARQDPGNVQVTEALLGLYRDTRQGQKAADVLQRLLEAPEVKADPARAARLHHAVAQTLRDDLSDPAGAARELEAALDADPRLVQAFADLEALLTAGQQWRELEQAYLRMIQRLPKGPESSTARLALWKTLAELYQRALSDPENARMAYEVVTKADPDDAAALEAHAALAAKLPGHEGEAIAAWRRLLALGAPAQRPLSALVALHAERKDYDQAYSAAQALTFLAGGASPEEAQVVSRLRRFARDAASGTLDDARWAALLHERARGPLAAILALLARDAAELFVQQPKELGLTPKKDELDVAGSMLFLVNMYKYVARTLGMPAPRLFRPGEAGGRLQLLPLAPPAVVAGEDLFRERPKKELWFTIGKALAFLRPELTLARLMPHDQLDAVFQAAASLGTSRFVVTADPHLVEKLKRRLEKALPAETRTQQLKVLARAYCDVQHPGDVRAYMDAAELTSNRAGALLAGDLDVVRKMVVAEKAAVSKLREETRLRDLVLFCTSEAYGELRRDLGLSVVVPA
ncbi:tetratricopeptide repeat protein [Anaeromyxobacter diazotrophicus]|uniref:tetratricopeptide repeat protein n=1 Tax=Anaeromyxobacter diazotrophicus TaxID=2590199 RepID=UPI0015919A6E|nr:tetratricopeptide repeat protein [Anaeromyxobacter diazotrophicus]